MGKMWTASLAARALWSNMKTCQLSSDSLCWGQEGRDCQKPSRTQISRKNLQKRFVSSCAFSNCPRGCLYYFSPEHSSEWGCSCSARSQEGRSQGGWTCCYSSCNTCRSTCCSRHPCETKTEAPVEKVSSGKEEKPIEQKMYKAPPATPAAEAAPAEAAPAEAAPAEAAPAEAAPALFNDKRL